MLLVSRFFFTRQQCKSSSVGCLIRLSASDTFCWLFGKCQRRGTRAVPFITPVFSGYECN